MYAELSMDHMLLKKLSKKTLSPPEKKEIAQDIVEEGKASIRQVCRLVQLNRGSYYYQAKKRADQEIRTLLKELSIAHPRWG